MPTSSDSSSLSSAGARPPASIPGTVTAQLLARLFPTPVDLSYRWCLGTWPSERVDETAAGACADAAAIDAGLLEELWRESGAPTWGLAHLEFAPILLAVGTQRNFGAADGEVASARQQAAFFRGLKLAEVVLARACARGHEGAWDRFISEYRQPILRAAMAIAGSETLGRDLADQLYGELYGLTERDGVRRSPLDSYQGRGSLMGWLRTTLAQRHIDRYRRNRRELSLEDAPEGFEPAAVETAPPTQAAELRLLAKAVETSIHETPAKDRLLLAAYFIDGRTLLEIGRVLGVHEATVSRRLHRLTGELRKQVIKYLKARGFSRLAAEDAIGVDPRDLDVHLKNWLQVTDAEAFNKKDMP